MLISRAAPLVVAATLGAASAPVSARVPGVLVARAGERAGLPPGLLAAVVWNESRGLNLIRLTRTGCDVGPAQVHLEGCSPLGVAWLLDVRENLRRGAQVLVWSRAACTANPRRLGCRWCIWGRYNPRSASWCARVLSRWRRPDA